MSAIVADYRKVAFDAIDEFDRITAPHQVIRHMASTLSQFGFSSFLVLSIPNAPQSELKQIALLNGWPQDWSTLYEREQYFQHDPMAAWALRTPDPFKWSDVPYDPDRNPHAAVVMRSAADFGMKEGFAIPIVRTESLDAITMAGERPDFDHMAKRAIHLIGLYAHSKTLALIRNNDAVRSRKVLSRGEREALTWTAAGKSSWEISVILGISEATVIWRIQRACAKLNAVNRTQAVVNAIRAKEINI
jgi:LuxR family quorum sensing-dependent transcriptional regulator